ncbi:RDD family protein [Microbacterium elymi]|uniref:RDD family protein n=1 Tax=Microbacterium elymi TaxID=2909587 RepID=A0ABY5NH83_9MICO|nr:RDD family protein [Microbacterium elymi]UUT34469.1 RDD family protein [Microbacterium elymi]
MNAGASLGARALAYVVDAAIALGAVLLVGGLVAAAVFGSLRPADPGTLAAAILIVQFVVWVTAVAWGIVYTLMQGGAGSVGQRLLGVELADRETGAPIGFWRALVRNIVWALAGSIVVGYFSPLFDRSPYRQGWHDLAARSVVARARTAAPSGPPVAVAPAVSVPPAVPPTGSVAPVLGYAPPPAAAYTPPSSTPPSSTPPSSTPPSSTPLVLVAPPRATPALPIEYSGVISAVPGFRGAQASGDGQLAASGPSALPFAEASAKKDAVLRSGSTADPSVPTGEGREAMSAAEGQTLGATVARDQVDAAPAPAPAAASAPAALLAWDNGTRTGVCGRTLFGRNPAHEDGATVVAVRDETLSLSKTHFEMGGDADGAWVIDRHSTNGVVLERNGRRARLVAGMRTPVRPGDRLEFGDRSVTVETAQ